MKEARLGKNGSLITIDEYQRQGFHKRSESRYTPYCDACGEKVTTAGIASLKVEASFRHYPSPAGTPEMNVCPNSSKASKRYSDLDCSEVNETAGTKLRKKFEEGDYVKKAYFFMLRSCGKKCLSYKQFEDTLRNANRKNIWNYVGMKTWMIPYVLLVLGDFQAREDEGSHKFHFMFSHKNSFSMKGMLKDSTGYKIERIYTNGGNPYFKKRCLPYPADVSKQVFEERTTNLENMDFGAERFRHLIIPAKLAS